jgi:hypothetical protein
MVQRGAFTLVAIVVLLLGIGLTLPSTFKVPRSIDVSAAPEKIYPLIADPREWDQHAGAELRNDLKNLKALAERSST